MISAWKELLDILPVWMRCQAAQYENAPLEEIRLRCASPPELIVGGKSVWLCRCVSQCDLHFCINTASQYSPWAASTMAQGFLTAPGGHRIGLCGDAIIRDGSLAGIRSPSSLCIRVARDISLTVPSPGAFEDSTLILGAPGWGKTTLLRVLARELAQQQLVTVVDERQELFPWGFPTGKRMDVLTGCPKSQGIEIVLRTMGPQWIAVDEITAAEDCLAILQAARCGVKLLATAHAAGLEDYRHRTVYAPLQNASVFTRFIILNKDKSFRMEEAA